jgi:enoyl-CoA hydratase/carnithine racemase
MSDGPDVTGQPTDIDRAAALGLVDHLRLHPDAKDEIARRIAGWVAEERAASYETGLMDGRRMMAADLRDVLDEAAR